MHQVYSLLVGLLIVSLSRAFSLNTSTKHWNYTTNNLASTTSQRCKDAYSADIACDSYLLQLVNANEERYFLDDMEPENFTQTCTAACHSSLTKYIANVRVACTERDDAAVSSLGFLGKEGTENVPVQTIGHILEYHLMRSCAKEEDGSNCYLTQSGVLPSDFSCTWNCALAYYWNRHFYPYSYWSLGDSRIFELDDDENETKIGNNMLLTTGHSDIMDTDGWKTIQNCGFGNSTKPPFDIGLSGKGEESSVPSVSKSSNETDTSGGSTTSTATSTVSGASSSTPSPTQTGAAGRSFYVSFSYLAVVAAVGLCTIL